MQLKEAQPVGARGGEGGAIHQGGVIPDDFVDGVGALVHAGDAVGQPAVKFQIDGAQQERQLLGMREKADVAVAIRGVRDANRARR